MVCLASLVSWFAFLGVLQCLVKLVLSDGYSPLSLHDLLLGEAHGVTQFLDGLLGVLLRLLVPGQLGKNRADVQDCPRGVALNCPKVLLEL